MIQYLTMQFMGCLCMPALVQVWFSIYAYMYSTHNMYIYIYRCSVLRTISFFSSLSLYIYIYICTHILIQTIYRACPGLGLVRRFPTGGLRTPKGWEPRILLSIGHFEEMRTPSAPRRVRKDTNLLIQKQHIIVSSQKQRMMAHDGP